MDSAKQLLRQAGIALLATIILIVVGVGSYAISQQVIPDNNSGTNNGTSNNSTSGTIITVKLVQKLEPKNTIIKKSGSKIKFQFDTQEKTGSVIYVTSAKSELIQQVVKDWSNGVKVAGTFYPVTSESSPSNAHSVEIDNTEDKIKENEYYYYTIILYNQVRIPYGRLNDSLRGPSEPYVISFTE